MSRPQKLHKPLKGGFNDILGAIAMGKGNAKRVANKLANAPTKPPENPPPKKP